ncbi:transcriptional corepressor LEUNIG_HOMOLOG-like [Diospyros lotus]|uniref:transcriptional corepressor LEUNIG_HOMOLOG-like n=1 Tax=Diospyros lotus TaxID=55363 RepID=UPI0022534DAC|nr:transcriptional corepressor LEUNIG_HOMOLOG-like [Diospyros lotus]
MNTTSSKLQENLTAHYMSEQDGFSFKEIHRLHSSKDGIVCCHFSSDGRFLAAAGHERKIHLWSMKGCDCITIGELHSDLITDIRFRPCSDIFATSSFDRTVKMWHANGIKQLFQFVGHTGKVTSIDFDPVNPDYFCSCDSTDEIRQWSISISSSRSVYKGASRQVRFQPLTGGLLASASGNTINLFDVKTDKLIFSFEGHVNEVHSICWDKSGAYVASVSEDSARIWSLASNGKCIHVLNSQGNRFGTGIFHPDHPLLLVVGSYQALQLWNPTTSDGTMSVTAHEDVISALADCRETGVVASAGKDEFVKIWK